MTNRLPQKTRDKSVILFFEKNNSNYACKHLNNNKWNATSPFCMKLDNCTFFVNKLANNDYICPFMLVSFLTVKSLLVPNTKQEEHRFSSLSKDHYWCQLYTVVLHMEILRMFKLIYGAVRCVSQCLWRSQARPSLRVPNKRVKIPLKRNRLVSMAAW